MASNQQMEILTYIQDLFASSEYSDLTITCGNDTYKVHKAIVCTRCGFFKGAESFRIASGATETKIDLPEDEPSIIKMLLEFLYIGDYRTESEPTEIETAFKMKAVFPHSCPDDDECGKRICDHHFCTFHCGDTCSNFTCRVYFPALPYSRGFRTDTYPSDLLTHAKVYEVAGKYDVSGLKKLSKEKFERICTTFYRHDIFSVATEHVFTTTPDRDKGLRNCVRDVLGDNPLIMLKPDIKSFLKKHPELMYQLLIGSLHWDDSG